MTTTKPTVLRRGELVGLLAMIMALTALSVDLMLPAFGEIRLAFGIAPDSADTAALVTVFLIGLASAQIVYGPLSDRFGRKPVIYVGFAIFALGAIGSALAPTFQVLLFSRFLWGVGAAGPRVISLAIVRDTHRGDDMARVMSLLMAVFLVVPVFAPSVGAAILTVGAWQAVFWACVVYVAIAAVWMIRLPETLSAEHRIELRFDGLRRAARAVVSERRAMAYALAIMVMFAPFVSYLGTSELFVEDVFGLGDRFPLIFGVFATSMGVAALSNSKLVGRFGAARLVGWVLIGYLVVAASLAVLALSTAGRPSFMAFAPLLAAMLAMQALLVPNMNSLAMEPMGAVAGTASALIGTAQTGGGALIGAVIDRFYDGTIRPLSIAFLIAGLVAYGLVRGLGGPDRTTRGAR